MIPPVHAGYFGPTARRLMGWLHVPPADGPRRTTGIVICAPLGYDALSAHRSLRHFAVAAASAGYPCLRFDYDGTGDSAGSDTDPARWETWRNSIRDAIRTMQDAGPVQRVVLLGVGLGGTLAATVSAEEPSVAGVAAVAPIVNGKAWLRERRALSRVMGRAQPPSELALPDGSDEVVGLLISQETRSAVERVDLVSQTVRADVQWLVMDRNDRTPNAAWIDSIGQRGARVEHLVLPGYVEMMQDPHESVVPDEMIQRFVDWMQLQFPESAADTAPIRALEPGPVPVTDQANEQTVHFGPSDGLFGVLATPIAAVPTRALVLVNAGSNHHIGNGRMYVEYARRLAAQGWAVLRFDVSGIGESVPHAGCPENEVYTAKGIDDLRDAVEWLRRSLGVKHVEGAGLCSGAYNVFRGAETGLLLDGIVVINPLVFRWRDGMSLKYPAYQMVQAAKQYQASKRDWRKWAKLLRGGVDLRYVSAVLLDQLRQRALQFVRDVRRSIGVPVPQDLGVALQSIAGRGVRVRFIFSEGDPGEALLRTGAGRAFTKLRDSGQLQLAHLPNCDHSLSASWMRELLWRDLDQSLNG